LTLFEESVPGSRRWGFPTTRTADYDFQVQSPIWPRSHNDSRSEDDLYGYGSDVMGYDFDYDMDSEN
jgi:hypothetical protein